MDQRLLEYELGKIVSVGRGRVGGSGGNISHHHGPSTRVSSTHTAGTSLDGPRIRVLRATLKEIQDRAYILSAPETDDQMKDAGISGSGGTGPGSSTSEAVDTNSDSVAAGAAAAASAPGEGLVQGGGGGGAEPDSATLMHPIAGSSAGQSSPFGSSIGRSRAASNAAASKGRRDLLMLDGHEISVVYFRAGYTPDDYPTNDEWEARALLEHSFAVKCPCIGYHLAGTKKVQQVLAEPGEVERFLTVQEEIAMCRGVFAGLFSLDPANDGLPLDPNSPKSSAKTGSALSTPPSMPSSPHLSPEPLESGLQLPKSKEEGGMSAMALDTEANSRNLSSGAADDWRDTGVEEAVASVHEEMNRLQSLYSGDKAAVPDGGQYFSGEDLELERPIGRTAAIAAARANPPGYVLKPQREGGGNNLYGSEMLAAFDSLSPEELASYILMERIEPPSVRNILLRNG